MRKFKALLMAACLGACVQTSATMLDDRRAMISAHGGVQHSTADILQSVLQRAALLGQQRGYTHFAILNSANASRQGAIITPGTATTYGNTTTFSPIMATPMILPGADVMVQFFRAEEVSQGTPGLWSVAEVLTQSE